MPECVDSPLALEDREIFFFFSPLPLGCKIIHHSIIIFPSTMSQLLGNTIVTVPIWLYVCRLSLSSLLCFHQADPVKQNKKMTLILVHSSLLCSVLWWGNLVYQSAATPPLSNLPLNNFSSQTTIGFTKVFYYCSDIKLKLDGVALLIADPPLLKLHQ